MIRFRKHAGIYVLETEQTLPIDLATAWDFFSSPLNLCKITPPYMGFRITSGTPEKMFAGQIITYRVGIFPGVVVNWVTEITHVRENKFFVDEQRFGPYAMWHHEHWFRACDAGVHMTDRVSYKLPLDPFLRVTHPFIKHQLRGIFTYRREVLGRLETYEG